MTRKQHRSLPPMRQGTVEWDDVLDKPIVILGRRTANRKIEKGGGSFDIWTIAMDNQMMDVIPRGNAPHHYHYGWEVTHPGEPLKVYITKRKGEDGYPFYEFLEWDEADEAIWKKMQEEGYAPGQMTEETTDDQVPF